MALISCLRKIGTFDLDEQKYILNRSQTLKDKGLSEKEANIQAVTELKEELNKTLKSVYKQLGVEQTKEVKTVIPGDYKLKPMRIAYKKGNQTLEEEDYLKLSKEEKEGYKEITKPAQVILPWNIRGEDGKILNIKNFIDESTGLLDTRKVPKEILTQFGFRIPNQGHNSMALIEVVGFLNDTYEGIVIASRNFITQMGSDFDVDKLYIYNYFTQVDKEGRVEKQKDNLQNQILDIHKSVLYNPEVFDSVVKPLDLGKLKYTTKDGKTRGIAQELKESQLQKETNYLSSDYDKKKYLESVDGKQMVGINAVGNTFLSIIQNKDLHLQEKIVNEEGKTKWVTAYITISDRNGKIHHLSDLSDAMSLDGKRSKTEIKSPYLSASVDNEKDPILSFLNHNPQTAAVEGLLIALGLDEDLSYMSAQPAIVEFANRVKIGRSSMATSYLKEEDVLSDLVKEYTAKVKDLDKKLDMSTLNFEDVPIGTKHFLQVLNKTNPERIAGLPELTSDEIQLLTLFKFAKIKQFADPFSRAQGLFNVDSKGIGKSVLEVSDRRDKIDKLFKKGPIANLHKVAGDVDSNPEVTKLYPDTQTGYAITNSIFAADDTFAESNLMPFAFQPFREIFKEYEDILDRDSTADQKYEIWKAVKAYNFAKLFTQEQRENLFFDRNNNKSLNTRISELVKTKLKNNPFLLRLDLSKVNVDGKLPSYVTYNAAKEEDIEEQEIYQGFLDLVNSTDPEVKNIGLDLVRYFYMNGGNQGAKEWGRYMNPKMLELVGIDKLVKATDFHSQEAVGFSEGAKVSPSLLQMIQHKPHLAPNLKEPIIPEKDGSIVVKGELPTALIRGLHAVPVFAQKQKGQDQKIYLYKETTKEGDKIYQQIPRLGTKFFSEYQNDANQDENSIAGTLLAKEFKVNTPNTTMYREKIMPSSPSTTPPFVSPLITEQIKPLVNTSLKESFEHINSNKYHESLVNLFSKLGNILDGVQVKLIQEPNENYSGKWDASKNTISINAGALDKTNKEQVEVIILKEVIHVINTKLFKGDFQATPEQIEAKKALSTLYQTLRDSVINGELTEVGWNKETYIKYQELVDKHKKKEALTQEEIKFLREYKGLYYGLTNLEDFMHEALLHPQFREALNKIKHGHNKSVLQRIGDLIAKILDGFRGLVTIKEGSLAEEAFAQIFKLTSNEQGTPNTNSTTEVTTKGDVIDLVLKLIEDHEFDVYGDTSKLRLDLDMSTKDIDKAVSDIKKRNFGSKPAIKLLAKLEAMRASGFLNYIQGSGGPEAYRTRTQRSLDDIQYDLADQKIKEEEEKGYTKIVNDFEVRLSSISKDVSKAYANNNRELATSLVNRYNDVKAERDNLIAENTFETITAIAKKDLAYVDSLLSNDNLQLNDLHYSDIVLGTWSRVDNSKIYGILTSFDTKNQTQRFKDVTKIAATARELQLKLSAIQVGRFQDLAEQETGKEITEDDLTKVKDISWIQSQTRDISTSDNVVLAVADKWIRWADFNAVTDLNAMIEKLEKLTKAVQDRQAYKDGGFEGVFGQVNDDQELTGEIVDALKASYYETRDELLADMHNAQNPETRKIAAKNYYDWVKANHIILDTNKLYKEDNDGIFIWSPDENYLKGLKIDLGEDYEKTLNKAKELTEEYNEELQLQINDLKDQEDGFRKLEAWRVANSPLIYLDNLKNGLTSRKVNGVYIKNQGWKYISKRVIGSWEDEKYNAIQKDQALKEYYDFYRETLKQLYHFLPYNIRRDLKPTEIPNINKDLIEDLTKVGAGKTWNRLWSKFLENISVVSSEPSKTRDPVTQGFQKDFKFDYLNKLDPSKKSYDLSRVLKLFATQAIGYKYKAQVEDQLRLADSILRDAVEKKIKSNGEVATDKFGDITTVKGLQHLYAQFDYAFDAFYGHKKEQREGVTGFKLITPKDKESMEKEIVDLPAKLSESERAVAEANIREKYTRKVSGGRIGDTLLQWVQLKGMGWNVFAGANNMIFGQMANYNWAAAGVDFDDKDMSKAVGVMLSFNKDTEAKVRALMTKFNTVKQLRDFVHRSTSNFNKSRAGIEKLSPYELYAKGEYFVQGQVMVAMLNHQQVEVIENGVKKTIPLYEAFDIEGNWDTKRFGENPDWASTSAKTYDFKNKLDSLLKRIHGNYDPNAAMMANKKWIGRAALQFRRWIPEGIAQRFDTEKYDLALQRSTKGRYLTYYDLGFKGSITTLLKQVLYRGNDKAFEGITSDPKKLAIIKENMRKNLREIYYKLSMLALFMVLSGDDDDDEWTKAGRNYTLNTILRLQDDIEFYYSPMAAENITRSALPVTAVIVDTWNFFDAIQDTVAGEGTYKSGIHSGDQKLYWRGARLFPFTTAVSGLLNKTEAQESFRK